MKLNKLIKNIFNKNDVLDLNKAEHLDLVKKIYGQHYSKKYVYEKMYRYYKGDTDVMRKYKFVTERSNLKTNVNYIKKFIKEEVSYVVGNPITYESRSGNIDFVNDIEYYTTHWDELHDSDLMKYLLIFTKVYEIYYLNKEMEFCSEIIKPTNGYAYKRDGKILFFIHSFKDPLDCTINYIDIYTSNKVYHFNDNFKQISAPSTHIFKEVPVTIGKLTLENENDSLYKDLKGLQDGFETNFSDIGNEISDFRNAYLTFIGCKVDEGDLSKMKEKGIMQTSNGKIDWLIKNINDTFVQNTLDRYVDTMYQISCHINHNEGLVSNLSGVALRSRLIALENKCKLEELSHKNIVKNRIRFLCKYLNTIKSKDYDYKDIKVMYTPNIPMDDLGTAQMLSQAPEGTISRDTARSLFSFIHNTSNEADKVKKEFEEEYGVNENEDN